MKTAQRLSQNLGSNIVESMGGKRTGEPGATASFPDGVVHGGPAAAKYRGAARLKDAFAIELERLEADPNQPRKEFETEALEHLAASLTQRGQLQPVRVRYDESSNRWIVVTGERRFRAAQLAGLSTLMCVEARGELSADQILEDQLVENCLREDLKPIEQAHAFKALIAKRGCSYRQLAETLHISHQAVVRALALLELPVEVQAKIDAGVIAPSAAAEIARVEDQATQQALIERIEARGMTRDEVSEAVRRTAVRRNAKATKAMPRAKARPPVDTRVRRSSNGVKIRIEATSRHTAEDVVQALRELADQLAREFAAQAEQAA